MSDFKREDRIVINGPRPWGGKNATIIRRGADENYLVRLDGAVEPMFFNKIFLKPLAPAPANQDRSAK